MELGEKKMEVLGLVTDRRDGDGDGKVRKEDEEEEEDDDDEPYSDDEFEDEETRAARADFFAFGNSLTVKGKAETNTE